MYLKIGTELIRSFCSSSHLTVVQDEHLWNFKLTPSLKRESKELSEYNTENILFSLAVERVSSSVMAMDDLTHKDIEYYWCKDNKIALTPSDLDGLIDRMINTLEHIHKYGKIHGDLGDSKKNIITSDKNYIMEGFDTFNSHSFTDVRKREDYEGLLSVMIPLVVEWKTIDEFDNTGDPKIVYAYEHEVLTSLIGSCYDNVAKKLIQLSKIFRPF